MTITYTTVASYVNHQQPFATVVTTAPLNSGFRHPPLQPPPFTITVHHRPSATTTVQPATTRSCSPATSIRPPATFNLRTFSNFCSSLRVPYVTAVHLLHHLRTLSCPSTFHLRPKIITYSSSEIHNFIRGISIQNTNHFLQNQLHHNRSKPPPRFRSTVCNFSIYQQNSRSLSNFFISGRLRFRSSFLFSCRRA
ncbi:hypothetical protein HanRHA438_Chr16g0781711 [Helianthus annuus]|nr:hypothetical protein HanRHA438_Chr16g0781711 [Helianthus annuus]